MRANMTIGLSIGMSDVQMTNGFSGSNSAINDKKYAMTIGKVKNPLVCCRSSGLLASAPKPANSVAYVKKPSKKNTIRYTQFMIGTVKTLEPPVGGAATPML